MRGVRVSGSSQRFPRGSVLSSVCGSVDHGHESRFGTRSVTCARSWIAGKQPTAKFMKRAMTLFVLLVLPLHAVAASHGPVFGLATPTNSQGEWSFDQGIFG